MKEWQAEISKFWEVFYEEFSLRNQEESCGCHIHIKPLGTDVTTIRLQRIAYAIVLFENHVLEILRAAERSLSYCRPNTKVSIELIEIFSNGKNPSAYEELAVELADPSTPGEIISLMQGDEKYVLWNFRNITKAKGTIEFRGAPGVHSAQETYHWILFALGFVLLALEEVFSFHSATDLA